MRGPLKTMFLSALLIVGVLVLTPQAVWIADGVAICTAVNDQASPQIASDGSGGAFIAWEDSRSGGKDIYAQRIDAGGNVQLTTDGVAICTAVNDQASPQIASDGSGGAFIAWEDSRSGGKDIYAQKVDAGGAVLWASDGVAISTAANDQWYPQIATDGLGGAIITWRDHRGGTYDDVYAQRIDAGGSVQWTANGVAISTAANAQVFPQITSDGSGGAIITWNDYRSGTSFDIYAQKIDGSGNIQWTSDGVAICTAVYSSMSCQIASDGSSGAIITWGDYRSGSTNDIYAQRIDAGGNVQWTANGAAISTAANNQDVPQIARDGYGGAIITWRDYRSGTSDIYAQRIDASGSVQWTSDGVAISTAVYSQGAPQIESDGLGGGIITWYDQRNGTSTYNDIYAQRIDAGGSVQWTTDGVAICRAANDQWYPQIATDGLEGAIITWRDSRSGPTNDIYAQSVNAWGKVGYLAPWIYAVKDLPGDQGGWVRLEVFRSTVDAAGQIIGYNVWRRTTGLAAFVGAQTASLSPLELFSRISETEQSEGVVINEAQAKAVGLPPGQWESLGFHAAVQESIYAFVVPTKNDSTSVGTPLEVYVVSAHTTTPSIYYVSDPDSGYSVDNLAPAQPMYLVAEQTVSPDGLALNWHPNTEPDLGNYAVHRGLSADFTPGSGNRIAATSDTTLFDGEWRWDSGYYYKVSAIDVHGNESPFALLEPEDVTGVGSPKVSLATYLSQNYPNPFNPSTTITYGLDRPTDVSLRVYDVSGKLVRVLVEGWREARHHQEEWDGRDNYGEPAGSGVYFYRLRAGTNVLTAKMVLLK